MKHIALPDEKGRRLIFYLSMEEYIARQLDEDECFFLWQVEPTVICGRNQLIEAEVNMDYCLQHGVQVYRRKSGGGCVYSDRGNLMLSYVTKGEHVGFIFDSFLRRVVWLLRKQGIDAWQTGRNDILVGDRKVSGNAFFQLAGKSIVHGTLLFQTDFDMMERVLTPSETKLKSKGVESVRKHVANLCEYTDMDIEVFKQYLVGELCDGERVLTASDIEAIEEMEKTYLDERFLYGCNPRYSLTRGKKIAGVGEVNIEVELKGNRIKGLVVTGDFFQLKDVQAALNGRLRQVEFTRGAVEAALNGMEIDDYILNLSTGEWLEVLF